MRNDSRGGAIGAEPSADLVELIGDVRALDIRLSQVDGSLRYDAPPNAVGDDLLARLRQHKPALLAWLADGPVVESSGPATYSQRRMHAQCLASAAPAGFNVAQRIAITGALDVDALRRAVTASTGRQSALRSRLVAYGGQLVQEVMPVAPVGLPLTDLRELPPGERSRTTADHLRRHAAEPFDLAVAPLLRTVLLRQGEQEWVLLLVVHHIVVDGWGLDVLLRELGRFYRAAVRVPGPRLPTEAEAGLAPLAVTYADVGRWQREHLSGTRRDQLRAYWRAALADAPMSLALPYDRPRPQRLSGRGGHVSVRISQELVAEVDALARECGATSFTVLLSAFGNLLTRLTGQRETVVACNIAGRVRREHEAVVGAFTNNVALRLGRGAGGTFAEAVEETSRTFFGALDHQEYPLSLVLADRAGLEPAGTPPFPQVVVVMQTQGAPVLELPGLVTRVQDIVLDTTTTDFFLILTPDPDGIEVLLAFSTDLFDTATMERWATAYVESLSQAVSPRTS
ncbi:condensation domain-containing protein [Streptomyces sp. SL13]|uniref:Condensation domain-containing protein n=1 Tax=Streptantibioticus silvisoli TaxID=2705255 RepID=A0AA90K7D5_9ACTN|nr:condensation domain-containing protein [Streptantibioticus silvisoli]MDI5968803.1 condensation domain-containing protein [Streptantibioticus silvisoli]